MKTPTTMGCPACGSRLTELRAGRNVIDLCRHCRGVWFDRGELTQFLDDSLTEQLERAAEPMVSPGAAAGTRSGGENRCPRCPAAPPLVLLEYKRDRNIVVSGCKQCGGVWVPRRELHRMTSSVAREQTCEIRPADAAPPSAWFPSPAPWPARLGPAAQRRSHRRTTRTMRGLDSLWSFDEDADLPWHAYLQMFVGGYDDNPTRRVPVLTIALIAVNVLVMGLLAQAGANWEAVYRAWGSVPNQLASLHGVTTLFTSQFLHGGLVHLLGNMLYLWIFGDNVEDRVGRWWYLPIYLGLGVAAGLTDAAVRGSSDMPAVGASGAISGVMGAYLVFFPGARVYFMWRWFFTFRIVSVPAWLHLGFWMALQTVALGVSPGSGVAYGAHVGGFVAGVILALVWRRLGPREEVDEE